MGNLKTIHPLFTQANELGMYIVLNFFDIRMRLCK